MLGSQQNGVHVRFSYRMYQNIDWVIFIRVKVWNSSYSMDVLVIVSNLILCNRNDHFTMKLLFMKLIGEKVKAR